MTFGVTKQQRFTFNHVKLGPLTGVVVPKNVVQFRAIPYATVPARFKQSILNSKFPETDGDYTEYGCSFFCNSIQKDFR